MVSKANQLAAQLDRVPFLTADDLVGSTALRVLRERQNEKIERICAIKRFYAHIKEMETMRVEDNLKFLEEEDGIEFVDMDWLN